jgi:RNA polymerase sigma-70 factor (ECF subfamily)
VLLHRRKSGRRRKLQQAVEQNGASVSFDATPAAQALHHEQAEAVREALAVLRELDQQLLQLKYTENWTYEQLAEHLGVSATTIEYRLLRGRKRLGQQLANRDVTEAGLP